MDQSDSEPMVSEGKKKTAEEVALDLEELRNLQSIAKQPHNVNLFASAIHTLEEELALDLEELRNLQSIAKRPHTVNLISSVICTLEKLPQGAATSVSSPALQYEKQDDDNVKLSQGGATLPTPTPISTAVPPLLCIMGRLGHSVWTKIMIKSSVCLW